MEEVTRSLVVTLFLLCCVSGSRSSGEVRPSDHGIKTQAPGAQQPTIPLLLTTTIIGKPHCQRESDQYTLMLKLRARFTNLSRQNIILFKGDNLVEAEMISRNEQEALARTYESNREFHHVFPSLIPPKRAFRGRHPPRQFVVLRPNASFESYLRVPITVFLEPRRIPSAEAGKIVPDEFGAIPTGEHVLQITVSTWLGAPEVAENLRQRWRRIGFFWFDSLTSQPMTFVVDKQQLKANCK